jgi:hypothetical protein
MARAYRGPYARQSSYQPPYATASVWGTGVDPVHGYYGEGPPLRMLGRHGSIGSSPVATDSPRDRDYQQPADASGMDAPQEITWGYPGSVDYSPDSFGQGADSPISIGDTSNATTYYVGQRPSWGIDSQDSMVRSDASTMTPWGTPGGRWFRALREGAQRYRLSPSQVLPGEADAYQPISAEPSNSDPTESVSEGWLNKVTSFVADANPSSPRQYEVQTSMRQRYGTRDNRRAVMRTTDDDRWPIRSRVMAMIEKVYSTGERLYDMAPYQIDQIERPFSYRTAGTGRADWMVTNEFAPMSPVRRTPPPDPAMGVPEVGFTEQETFGYTSEDTMYYG